MSAKKKLPRQQRMHLVEYNNKRETISGLDVDVLRQSGVKVKIIRPTQQPKKTEFHATPEGAAKRLAHKSRWHD